LHSEIGRRFGPFGYLEITVSLKIAVRQGSITIINNKERKLSNPLIKGV
jgi:hypothetical protein